MDKDVIAMLLSLIEQVKLSGSDPSIVEQAVLVDKARTQLSTQLELEDTSAVDKTK